MVYTPKIESLYTTTLHFANLISTQRITENIRYAIIH